MNKYGGNEHEEKPIPQVRVNSSFKVAAELQKGEYTAG